MWAFRMSRQCQCGGVFAIGALAGQRESWRCTSCQRYEIMAPALNPIHPKGQTMHEEDAHLEMQITLATAQLRAQTWPLMLAVDAAGEAQPVRVPLAYAAFRVLVEDARHDKDWIAFLREALEHTISDGRI